MVEVGHFALVLALALSLVQAVLPLAGARVHEPRMMTAAAPVAITARRSRGRT